MDVIAWIVIGGFGGVSIDNIGLSVRPRFIGQN
jgi:hypothetical protein